MEPVSLIDAPFHEAPLERIIEAERMEFVRAKLEEPGCEKVKETFERVLAGKRVFIADREAMMLWVLRTMEDF